MFFRSGRLFDFALSVGIRLDVALRLAVAEAAEQCKASTEQQDAGGDADADDVGRAVLWLDCRRRRCRRGRNGARGIAALGETALEHAVLDEAAVLGFRNARPALQAAGARRVLADIRAGYQVPVVLCGFRTLHGCHL